MDVPFTVFASSASLIVGALSAAVGALYLDMRKSAERMTMRITKLEEALDEAREEYSKLQTKVLDDQVALSKSWGAIAAVLDRQQQRGGR